MDMTRIHSLLLVVFYSFLHMQLKSHTDDIRYCSFLILCSRLFWGTFRAVSEFSLGNSRGAFHPGSSQPNHTTEHQSGVTSHGEMTPHHPQAQTKEVEVRGRRDGVGGWVL